MAENDENYGRQWSSATGRSDASPVAIDAQEPVSSELATVIAVDPWQRLRKFTQARIALGRVGTSLPTEEVLNFGYAHAMARDAVHLALDTATLSAVIVAAGFTAVHVNSRAADRATYLLRPDFGRRVDEQGLDILQSVKPGIPPDLVLVVGDGLSALAIHKHALAMLKEIRRHAPPELKLGHVGMVSRARVA